MRADNFLFLTETSVGSLGTRIILLCTTYISTQVLFEMQAQQTSTQDSAAAAGPKLVNRLGASKSPYVSDISVTTYNDSVDS